jgi:uncharacterized membrane protein YraQ (UPF0718 family)
MRVFHTSKGMPSDAASAIWMAGPMMISITGIAFYFLRLSFLFLFLFLSFVVVVVVSSVDGMKKR